MSSIIVFMLGINIALMATIFAVVVGTLYELRALKKKVDMGKN